jgi:SAM-dependent methyltransferase
MSIGSAELYDAVYSHKEYAREGDVVRTLIEERRPGANSLLDVACGTGRHLERLKEHYQVEGVDLDPGLLAAAAGRLPGVPLHQSDMRDFDLGRRFDAVTCLFSAIGYAQTVDGLASTTAAMARHLEPGGIVLIDPWYTPETWAEQRPALLSVDVPDLKVARINVNGTTGRLALVDFHFLVATAGGVEYFTQHHELGLFSDNEYLSALREAGLDVDHDPIGLSGRGVYIGMSAD